MTPPKTIDEAELNIIKSLVMYIDMGIDEEFDYDAWTADSPIYQPGQEPGLSTVGKDWETPLTSRQYDYPEGAVGGTDYRRLPIDAYGGGFIENPSPKSGSWQRYIYLASSS